MADYELDAEAQALVDSGAYVVKTSDDGAPFLMPASVDAGARTKDFGGGWPAAKPAPASDVPPAAPASAEEPPPVAASTTDGQEASQDGGNVAPVVPPAEEGGEGTSGSTVPVQG